MRLCQLSLCTVITASSFFFFLGEGRRSYILSAFVFFSPLHPTFTLYTLWFL